MQEFHATEIGKKIWTGFAVYKLSGIIVRSGCALTGAYGNNKPFVPFLNLPIETDLAHVAGVSKLLSLISAFYPEIVPPDELTNYTRLAEAHDMGEFEFGDIPGDGTRDEAICNANEREWVKAFAEASYPPEVAAIIIAFYDEFVGKTTARGKIFYMFGDKLEGILAPLFYESIGAKPNILNKILIHKKNPDELIDVISTEFTQTTLVPDNFLYSEFYNPEFFNYPYLRIFLEIIQSAAVCVRGHEMKWLNIEFDRRSSGYYKAV